MSNGKELLPGIDHRTSLARRFRDITQAVVVDQGGLSRLSEARLQLIRRFAASCVLAEQMEAKLAGGAEIDVTAHCQLSSTMTRLVARIGIGRAQKVVPSLSEYLDSKQPPPEIDAEIDVADDAREAAE